jgi:hypothetical protein
VTGALPSSPAVPSGAQVRTVEEARGWRRRHDEHKSVPDIACQNQEECTMAGAALGRVTPERLTVGDGRPLLVVDFQPFSSAPRLSALLGEHADGRPVYRLDPLPALARPGGYLPLSALAAQFADGYAADADGRAVTVVGSCTAPALALRVGTRLAATRPVSAVLVGPQWPDLGWLARQYAAFRADLGALPGPEPDLDGDPAEVLGRMERTLRADLEAMAVRRGLGDVLPVLEELLSGYRAWLAFLLACAADAAAPGNTAGDAALDISILTSAADDAALPAPWPRPRRVRRTALAGQPAAATPALARLVLAACEDR